MGNRNPYIKIEAAPNLVLEWNGLRIKLNDHKFTYDEAYLLQTFAMVILQKQGGYLTPTWGRRVALLKNDAYVPAEKDRIVFTYNDNWLSFYDDGYLFINSFPISPQAKRLLELLYWYIYSYQVDRKDYIPERFYKGLDLFEKSFKNPELAPDQEAEFNAELQTVLALNGIDLTDTNK